MTVKYLHTMVRVKDLEKSMAFFELLGLNETRRIDVEEGRFSLVFMAPPGQEECPVELTYNWGWRLMRCPMTAAILDTSPIALGTSTKCANA